MTRLFVALWPFGEALAAIRTDVDRVRALHPGLRWQPPERWHITLAFLGPADAQRTIGTLDRLLAEPPAAGPVRTSGAGTFGSVLWLGVERAEWLTDLARHLQRGLHPPDHRFRAHVTVARGRGPGARADAAAAVPDLVGHRGPEWTPHEVTLVDSVTGPAPAYTVVRAWPLLDARRDGSDETAATERRPTP